MINLKLDKEEAAEQMSPEMYSPEYPGGTCLYLDTKTLEKLGMTTLPEAGSVMAVEAMATVRAISEKECHGEIEKCVELQITDLALSKAQPKRDAAEVLYGSDAEE